MIGPPDEKDRARISSRSNAYLRPKNCASQGQNKKKTRNGVPGTTTAFGAGSLML